MLIIGLTGSIAMGKSTVANLIAQHNVPIISADDIVHELYRGKAIPLIEATFPGCTNETEVDRQKLMQSLNNDKAGFKKLESIIHPLVRREEWLFIKTQKQAKTKLVIIEIPLLYETGADKLMDAVILVSASGETQKQRALDRPTMTEEKFEALLAKQMPDTEKRAKADFIINTDKTLEETASDVEAVINQINEDTTAKAYKIWENLQT